MSALDGLGLSLPVLAAPMAGGPTTKDLVVAAARAGSLGFVAAGYRDADAVAQQIREVRSQAVECGVNVFAPNPVAIDEAAFRLYANAIADEGEAFGLELGRAALVEDDDQWAAKVQVLVDDPVPLVSFTFGIPSSAVVARLRRAGTVVAQTVTSAAEARLAEEAGVDALVVQGWAAGGHSGTVTPSQLPERIPLPELVSRVRAESGLPVVAAGGLSSAVEVATVLAAGAEAVAVGTALLLADESGASAVHRAALADPSRGETVLTRAFTGRPARAVPNRFVERYDAIAPLGYPAVHHLTSPLRKAAAAAGDPELVNLWAGTGYRSARPGSVADILTGLAAEA